MGLFLFIDVHFFYAHKGNLFTQIAFCSLAFVNMAIYFISIQKNRRKIEKLFPYRPPFNLLALRVFGSSHLNNFLTLIHDWRYFGTMNRLDGPDTVGMNSRYFTSFLKGKINDAIVEDEQELANEFRQFSLKPDGDLLFSVNSMQCTNNTWKEAIQKMIDDADVIVLDFSNLNQKRQGISYELKKLVEEVPLQKILLLVDDSTDRNILDNLLQDFISNLPYTSPNRNFDFNKIQVFDTGGMDTPDEGENLYDFQRRAYKRLDSDRLIGLVLDKALAFRTLEPADPVKDAPFIYWTGFGFSFLGRKIWNAAMVVLAVCLFWLCIFR